VRACCDNFAFHLDNFRCHVLLPFYLTR
jgi:hypothetical protein